MALFLIGIIILILIITDDKQQATKGGLGTSFLEGPRGLRVGALAVVNAFGDVVDPETGTILAGARRNPDSHEFVNTVMMLRQGIVRGFLHPGLGQEAVHVGACYGLEDRDYITLSHRGKEPELMKGWSMKDMLAGQMCKKESYGGGRTPDGSHMYGDLVKGIIPSPGIIGSVIPVAAGVGLG